MDTHIEKTGKDGLIYVEDDGSFVRVYYRCLDPTFTGTGIEVKWDYHSGRKSGKFNVAAGGEMVRILPVLYVQISSKLTISLPKSKYAQIGGPTTFTLDINRGSGKPDPPKILSVDMINATTCRVRYQWVGGGGQLVGRYNLRYATVKGAYGTHIVNTGSSGTYDIKGLKPNTLYHIQASMTNVEGVSSGWGEYHGVYTSGGVKVFYDGMWRNAVPLVKYNGAWKRAQAYVKKNGAWVKTL